jgi:hypothetical protein
MLCQVYLKPKALLPSMLCSSTLFLLVFVYPRSPSSNRRGIPSRLLIFPDENHWVLKHGNR